MKVVEKPGGASAAHLEVHELLLEVTDTLKALLVRIARSMPRPVYVDLDCVYAPWVSCPCKSPLA